jgi:hypothetical protein
MAAGGGVVVKKVGGNLLFEERLANLPGVLCD